MTLWRDCRLAARLLFKDRWFTLAAVIALAFGIGAATTAFTVVNAITRGLPVNQPDRIVRIAATDRAGRQLRLSFRDLEEWRAAKSALSGIAAFREAATNVSEPGRSPERISASFISANGFQLLGERPILGRTFLPEDDRLGAPAVAILGGTVWRNRYGSAPSVVGRTVIINGTPSTIVGVMRDGFRFPVVADLWQPISAMPAYAESRDARVVDAFGRLTDANTMRQAESELETIAARLGREYPETSRDVRPKVSPYVDSSGAYPFLGALMGAVVFVLLIGCANVANLLMARAAHRSREIAIRLSQGATRWQIIRQWLVESTLLATIAGAMGFSLSVFAIRLLVLDLEGINFPYWQRWTMDGPVVAFFAVVCLGSTFGFAIGPAIRASRTSMSEALSQSGQHVAGGLRLRGWTSALLTAELAFTLILLSGAGLMMRSFAALYRADLVIDDPSNVLLMPLALPAKAYATPEQRTMFYERLEERLRGVSATSLATTASSVPFIPTPRRELSIDGNSESPGTQRPTVSYVSIGSGYFETLGLRLIRGRAFTNVDGMAGRESAIVNQRFVTLFFPNSDPIGRHIRLTTANAPNAAPSPWVTIVGISPSVRQQQPTDLQELDAVVFVPRRADPGPFAWLVVRGDPASVAPIVRTQVWALDADLALDRIVPLKQFMTQSRWAHGGFMVMFAVFAWISVVLAIVGLYAVTAYNIAQRTREIGIRMALGARGGQVMWLFVGRALAPLCIGLVIGLAGAFGVGRLLQMFLMQTSPGDPVTLGVTAALLIIATLAACSWPARRATRLDPAVALRAE